MEDSIQPSSLKKMKPKSCAVSPTNLTCNKSQRIWWMKYLALVCVISSIPLNAYLWKFSPPGPASASTYTTTSPQGQHSSRSPNHFTSTTPERQQTTLTPYHHTSTSPKVQHTTTLSHNHSTQSTSGIFQNTETFVIVGCLMFVILAAGITSCVIILSRAKLRRKRRKAHRE